MKRLVAFISALFFIFVLLISCGTTKNTAIDDGSTNSKIVAEKSPELELSFSNLVIELESNPTTGFSWDCEIVNSEVVEIISDTYRQNPAPESMVGVGGTQIFVFKCKQSGESEIIFTYRRSWEGGETAEIRKARIDVDSNLQGNVKFLD